MMCLQRFLAAMMFMAALFNLVGCGVEPLPDPGAFAPQGDSFSSSSDTGNVAGNDSNNGVDVENADNGKTDVVEVKPPCGGFCPMDTTCDLQSNECKYSLPEACKDFADLVNVKLNCDWGGGTMICAKLLPKLNNDGICIGACFNEDNHVKNNFGLEGMIRSDGPPPTLTLDATHSCVVVK